MRARKPNQDKVIPHKQVSVFRSPAAKGLGFFGAVGGSAVGVVGGFGKSIHDPDHLGVNVVGGAILGSLLFGTLGFFSGAIISALGRTKPVESAIDTASKTIKNLWK